MRYVGRKFATFILIIYFIALAFAFACITPSAHASECFTYLSALQYVQHATAGSYDPLLDEAIGILERGSGIRARHVLAHPRFTRDIERWFNAFIREYDAVKRACPQCSHHTIRTRTDMRLTNIAHTDQDTYYLTHCRGGGA